MTKRSEREIRREVERRLRRRGLLVADWIFWLLAGFTIYAYDRYNSYGRYGSVVVLFMLFWTALLGLHTLAVAYIELREWMVQRAINQEREFYALQIAYEKRKRDDRDEPASRNVDEARPLITDDGELSTFSYHTEEDHDHAQRSRNS